MQPTIRRAGSYCGSYPRRRAARNSPLGHVAFASAKAEASLKRYKAPPPIGPTDKIPIELDPFHA